jgi:hypothetical protein
MKEIAVFLLALALVGCNGGDTEEPESPPVDEPPILTVTGLLDQTVATPEVLVMASCSDDRGDCRLGVAADSQFVGEGATNELSREFDLSDFDGQMVTLRVTAIDSAGQTRSESRLVHVEGSPDLTNERAFPLRVVDFDGQRALLQSRVDPIGSELTIVEAASGIEENVGVPGQLAIQEEAYLTPTGAVFSGLLEGDIALGEAYDWNHSLLVELEGFEGPLRVAGDYATWVNAHEVDLLRRQFSTMTDLVVHDLGGEHSVASNGVVAFSTRTSFEAHSQVMKFDAGVTTTLTADADRDSFQPTTDGQGVVYTKYNPEADRYEIAFHDGNGETILTGPRSESPERGSDYAIAGGWVAFTEFGELGKTNVWTRDPSGTLLQRTAFNVDSLIETLAPDGEVMVVTTELRTLGKFAGIARYLSRPTGELTRVSSELGWSTRIGDTWYVIIGRSVFQVR